MKRLNIPAQALFGAAAASLTAIAWWHAGEARSAAATESAAWSAPTVPVANVLVRNLSAKRTFIGHLEAFRAIDVTPQVHGMLIEASVPEGGRVSEGELLFRIDPEPFEIQAAAAQAQLDRALALAGQAAADLTRAKSLFGKGSASQKVLEEAQTTKLGREAEVAATRAAVREAEMRLGYTSIRAPFNGTVGRIEKHPGNQVAAGPTNRLTRIVVTDQLYVTLHIDEATYLRLSHAQTRRIAVEVEIGANPDLVLPGWLDFLSPEIDRETGTLLARAVIDNADNRLKPGLFARVRVPVEPAEAKILVSESAINSAPSGRYVLTVDEAGTVVHRPVKLGDANGALRIVNHGLHPGDRIILKGLVRPGMSVTPTPVSMPGDKLSAVASPSNGGML